MTIRRVGGVQANKLSTALLAALALSVSGAVLAQEGASDEDTDPAQASAAQSRQATTLDRVSVTGSRIKRVDLEGPAPMTVITAEDIQKSGLNTIYEVLNTLTQVTGDVDNEMNPGSWTPNGAFINLRAMGPGYTLTLINGRRMADYPLSYRGQSNAVSVSSIPAGAVERIEVLSGGASAIYGSDAVAGVVNIITKDHFEGDEFRLRGSTTTRGGGDSGLFQWSGGRTGDKWSVTYGAEYFAREAVLGNEREFMDSYRDNPAFRGREEYVNNPATGIRLYRYAPTEVFPVGVPVTSNYWLDASGNLVAENAADGSGVDALRYNCAKFGDFEPYNTSADISNVTGTPNGCGFFGQPATQTIQSEYNRTAVFVSGSYDFDNGLQFYGQFLGTQLESMTASGTRFIQPPGGTIYSPNLGRMYFLRYLTLDEIGSPQKIQHEETTYNVTAGLRGSFFDNKFDWDLGIAHSRFEYEGRRPYLLTGPTLNHFFGGQPEGTVGGVPHYPNVTEEHLRRWLSPITPEIYRTIADDMITIGESSSSQANFIVSGDLFDLPAGPLGMAAVAEWGTQKYEQTPDVRTTTDYTGDDKALGLTSTRGSGERDRYAVGVELSVPIFSQLKASLAGRYDNIEGMADSAVTWSAGLEYRPFSNLMLRGNFATSYRAPDMAYVFAEESGGYGTYVDYYRCRRDGLVPTTGTDNPCSTSTGNPNYNDYVYQIFSLREGSLDLGPEEGKSFTAGFVWDVIDGMSLSMDYYNIELEGKVSFLNSSHLLRTEADCRLGQTEAGAPVDSNSAQCQDFLSFVERAQDDEARITTFWTFPYNQALTKTSGIDTSWTYRFGTRWGDFNLRAGHTLVLTLEDQAYAGGEVIDRRVHRQYFDFRSRANWGVSWAKDGWSASLSGYRLGSLPNWAEDDRIDPFVVWNGSVSRDITDNFRFGLTVSNLFDAYPPNDDTFDTFPFFWRAYQVGAIGRQVGAEFRYRF